MSFGFPCNRDSFVAEGRASAAASFRNKSEKEGATASTAPCCGWGCPTKVLQTKRCYKLSVSCLQ